MVSDQNRVLLIELTKRIFTISPLTITQIFDKGITNDVFVVDLPESKIIVRISPENNVDQFKKEEWEMGLASQLHIPTPKVIDVGIINNVVYMVEEYVDGTHGTDYSNSTHVWTVLGQYAKTIHSMQVKGFGDHMASPGEFDSNRKDFREYVKYNIDRLNAGDKLLQMGILTSRISEKIRTLFENLQKEKLEFGLNHGDLSLNNVIVDKNGKVYLLDWGSSESHIIPHFDFMEVLQSSFNFDFKDRDFASFLEGYGLSLEQFLIMKPTINTLLILTAIDKLRWSIETNQKKIDHFKKRLIRIFDYIGTLDS